MLTPKKIMFAREYIVDLNATQAAIRSGYSKKTAASQGERLLRDVDIARLVQENMDARSQKTGITAELVLSRVNRIAENAESTGDYFAALRANELLGKHLKLFRDVVEHTGKVTLEDIVVSDG